MYNLSLTEEEISVILQALSYYKYHPYITKEFYNIASKVQDKINEII